MTGFHDRTATMAALKQALPYIRLFKGKVFVIKIGGGRCGEPEALHPLVQQVTVLTELGIRVVLVHGGGPQTTALARELGVEPQFVDGRRVTCERTLEVAVMTMNGSVNTAILAACRAAGIAAVGLSGIDAGLVRAARRPPRTAITAAGPQTIDFGHVGDILAVDPRILLHLLEAGYLPVVSPVTADDEGLLLNVNADTVAAGLAAGMGAEKLIFISDARGILEDRSDPTTLISYLDLGGLDRLVALGVIDQGMMPKVQAAKQALAGGVKRVHVIGEGHDALLLEIFTNEGAGTLIVSEMRELSPAEQAAAPEEQLAAPAEQPAATQLAPLAGGATPRSGS